MEAEMYGMIPNANTDALLRAPPENMFNKPNRPPSPGCESFVASTPGRTI